jgi:predicted RecB family nuclease
MIRVETASEASSQAIRLSKSKFLSGLQCHKRLYLEIHAPELASEPDDAIQAILDTGTEIGALARRRFPGGVLVEAGRRHSAEALQHTQDLIQDPTVSAIFEGAFAFDQILVRVDILERVNGSSDAGATWRLIEVKSSSKVKEVYVDDLAIQTHVLRGTGVILAESCLMRINTQYVFTGGESDLDQLFALQDLTAVVAARQSALVARLGDMKTMLARPCAPEIEPDSHCHQPYACPFWDHCTKDKPKRWVYYLPGDDRLSRRLFQQGIETIDDIPAGVSLSILQRRMRDNVEWIGQGLKAALHSVRYPVHHLDFETFMPAVPKFPMTRPYQTIPTQWSNHIEMDNGHVHHDEHLCMEPRDAREELVIELLRSLGQEGSICVYSGYERSILERLAELLPSLKREIQQVVGRLWDLFLVIREHYYHPSFEGSFSIKSVLPAVVPSLSYDDLEIREGGLAARAYYRMVFEEMDLVEKLRLREALLKYCERDTLAMLELRKALSLKDMSWQKQREHD